MHRTGQVTPDEAAITVILLRYENKDNLIISHEHIQKP